MNQYDGTDRIRRTTQQASILNSLGVRVTRQQFEFMYKTIRQGLRARGLAVPSRQEMKLLIGTSPAAMRILQTSPDLLDRALQVQKILVSTGALVAPD